MINHNIKSTLTNRSGENIDYNLKSISQYNKLY